MHVFCDESGNTGTDLLNSVQPVFALASTCISEDIAVGLIGPLIRKGQKEAKYSKLKGSRHGQQDLIKFFSSSELNLANSKFMLADKKYYLISHLVDKLIEPSLHEAGIDLYASDAHVGLTNVWYMAGHTIFPFGYWDKVQKAFLQAIRLRTESAYSNFDYVLTQAAFTTPWDSRDYAAGLLLARGRLSEFVGVYTNLEVFDPAVDLFTALMHKWMLEDKSWFSVTHDRSKPLKRNERFLRALMTSSSASRVIGYGDRQVKLPLRISTFGFGDSETYLQLQVADIIAGAAIDCLLGWSGKRPCCDFLTALQQTKLPELFMGGMLPSNEIVKTTAPNPGEQSLVDGATAFLRESGYQFKE